MKPSAWFNKARFGLFLHWGPYSVAGRGEWVMNRERIDLDTYIEEYIVPWTARYYDPAEWAAVARMAGMEYVVLTARHHDGFALWDTRTTPYNAARMGPQRDLVGPFVEAARAAGLRVGLYYSVADWRHPDYPGAYFRDWPESSDWHDDKSRKRFVQFYQAQLRELLSNYGQIDLLWYDGCIPGPLEGESSNRMAKELQPDILINERNGPPYDFRVSEQSLAAKEGPWEACITLNRNWGWHAGDNNWKPAGRVLEMLVQTAGSGGNLLVNIGPKPDGTLPSQGVQILRDCGAWLSRNREFLADSEVHGFSWNNTCLVTQKENQVYLHFINQPGRTFCWAELDNRVRDVRFLATGLPIEWEQDSGRLIIRDLPVPLPDDPITTVAVRVEGKPRPRFEQKNFWIPE